MPQGPWVESANTILISPTSDQAQVLEFEVGANATAAKMIPGTIVVFDTVATDVKESGAEPDFAVGVLEAMPDMKITDNYAVGDPCRVITGRCICRVRLKASENVAVGDLLKAEADGLAAKLATGNLGEQGAVVAVALEASNTASIVYLTVLWLGQAEAATAT